MKTTRWMIATAATVFALASCGKKSPTVREEVSDKVGDALNTRDHEKLRDAAEDLEKDVKKVGEGLGKSLKEAGKAIKKEADKATE
jgi:predicted small lipoprotein YifL